MRSVAGTCARQVTEEERPLRDVRTYTPKHLADKILASRSALEDERKQVTVLFADVKGSMELAESVDAEEWHRILDGLSAVLSDGVHRFEGTVNQYTGDGIMGLRARRDERPASSPGGVHRPPQHRPRDLGPTDEPKGAGCI